MRVHISIRLPSVANTRKCWQAMASLKKKQRAATERVLRDKEIPPLPLVVTITRVGPRKLDDDNLTSSCKYVRDQIAEAVGTDDGSSLYTWRYEQRTGEYGVDLEIVTRGDGI